MTSSAISLPEFRLMLLIGAALGNRWTIEPLGPLDDAHGAPLQVAVFTR